MQDARRYYNAVVRDLNTRIAQFPVNLIAGPMGFRPREFFVDRHRGAGRPAWTWRPAREGPAPAGPQPRCPPRSRPRGVHSSSSGSSHIVVDTDATIDVTEINVAVHRHVERALPHHPGGVSHPAGIQLDPPVRTSGRRDRGQGRRSRSDQSRERHYLKYKIWVPGAQDATTPSTSITGPGTDSGSSTITTSCTGTSPVTSGTCRSKRPVQ